MGPEGYYVYAGSSFVFFFFRSLHLLRSFHRAFSAPTVAADGPRQSLSLLPWLVTAVQKVFPCFISELLFSSQCPT